MSTETRSGEFAASQERRDAREAWVNVGDPPITGLKEVGGFERKQRCEDAKVNDPEHGLFLVADGVSSANGWFASAELAKAVQDGLGASLDAELRGVQDRGEVAHRVRDWMFRTIAGANDAIYDRAHSDPRLGEAGTTMTLARLVHMPDGGSVLFFANVGDSRLYMRRNGHWVRLTVDDSYLMQEVQRGRLTDAQAVRIDQTLTGDDLNTQEREIYRRRNIITRAIGQYPVIAESSDEPTFEFDALLDVQQIAAQPGDVFVLADDGLTDQYPDVEWQEVFAHGRDDRSRERKLQLAADRRASDGRHPRAKGDDISVIVHTVRPSGSMPGVSTSEDALPAAQVGGESSEARAQTLEIEAATHFTPERVAAWRAQLTGFERRLLEARTRGEDTEDLEREVERFEYWIARADVDHYVQAHAPRFASGDRVFIGPQQIRWEVRSFDPTKQSYLVAHPSGQLQQVVDRFDLELAQQGMSEEERRACLAARAAWKIINRFEI